jgi:hypothetical protein
MGPEEAIRQICELKGWKYEVQTRGRESAFLLFIGHWYNPLRQFYVDPKEMFHHALRAIRDRLSSDVDEARILHTAVRQNMAVLTRLDADIADAERLLAEAPARRAQATLRIELSQKAYDVRVEELSELDRKIFDILIQGESK